MRLIDADEIRIKPEYMHDICGSVMIRVEDVARILNEMPTINSQPRQKGKWIEIMDADEFGEPYPCGVRCSECGFCSVNLDDFCPNCGAKMENDL